MAQQVLLFTKALPTRLAVRGAFSLASIEPVLCSNPLELLEKTRQGSWDVIIVDGESSSVPLPKLLAGIGAHAAQAGTVVLALAGSSPDGEAATEAATGEVLLYDRPLGRMPLLGAANRMLMARGKKPILRVARKPSQANQRRALRVPMLVPVAYRSPARHTAWTEGEVLDISIGGAGVATISGFAPGEILDVRNLLTQEESSFRLVWVTDELEEIAGGIQTSAVALRFWLPT